MAGYAIGTIPSPETVGTSSDSRNPRPLPPAQSLPLYDLKRAIVDPSSHQRTAAGRSGSARSGPGEYASSNAGVKLISPSSVPAKDRRGPAESSSLSAAVRRAHRAP